MKRKIWISVGWGDIRYGVPLSLTEGPICLAARRAGLSWPMVDYDVLTWHQNGRRWQAMLSDRLIDWQWDYDLCAKMQPICFSVKPRKVVYRRRAPVPAP